MDELCRGLTTSSKGYMLLACYQQRSVHPPLAPKARLSEKDSAFCVIHLYGQLLLLCLHQTDSTNNKKMGYPGYPRQVIQPKGYPAKRQGWYLQKDNHIPQLHSHAQLLQPKLAASHSSVGGTITSAWHSHPQEESLPLPRCLAVLCQDLIFIYSSHSGKHSGFLFSTGLLRPWLLSQGG